MEQLELEPSRKAWIEVDNPATGEIIQKVPEASIEDTRRVIDEASAATKIAEAMPAYKRARLLAAVASMMEQRAAEFARTITLESGKPIKESQVEVTRAVGVFTFAAEEAKRIYGEVFPADAFEYPPKSENRLIFSQREPIGVVVAIGPFNFPLNLLAHKIAPALAAGNTVITKPTSETPLTALLLKDVISKAGWPEGIFSVVVGPGSTIGGELIENPKTNLITFTGSTEVGLDIAGRAAHLGKKTILEMGGMDPFIVLDDANLDIATSAAIRGAFSYSGQVCTASKRFLVEDSVAEPFVKALREKMLKLNVGNPILVTTDMGPVINKAAVKRIDGMVADAVAGGAELLEGGKPLTEGDFAKGSYYAPTLLDNVRSDMRVGQEEPFAPLAPVFRVGSDEEAIEVANSTKYGLQASIFTKNIARALKMARHVKAGAVLIDDPTNLRWDNAPFGGVKKSGMGREGVRFAIQEMTESKLIDINLENAS
ncbi:MAG TPA: aldehyde dehydrogenase family protein [Nitrososphaerales archaeon]|nr:aldehyde dehydrogenase family protein [Nitrososphaerales archaeon]